MERSGCTWFKKINIVWFPVTISKENYVHVLYCVNSSDNMRNIKNVDFDSNFALNLLAIVVKTNAVAVLRKEKNNQIFIMLFHLLL